MVAVEVVVVFKVVWKIVVVCLKACEVDVNLLASLSN